MAPAGAKPPSAERSTAAWIGRVLGPPLAVALYWWLPDGGGGLSHAGRATAAVGCLMAVLWITEAMPLAATALLPIVLFPLLGVASIRQVTAPYAHEYIFLFMGGFMLAGAIQRWDLHRRMALLTVRAIGTTEARLVAGFMAATALLSMWISNTATAIMMLPIAASLVTLLDNRTGQSPAGPGRGDGNFATCLMLGIAYAASIGGMATLIGTPPNLILAAFLKDRYAMEIGFGQWLGFALPLVVVFLVLAWLVLTKVAFPLRRPSTMKPAAAAARQVVRDELSKLGPLSRGEWTVGVVFLLTASGWIARQPLSQWTWLVERVPAVERLHDAQIALAAALVLFAIPVDARRGVFALDWQTARKLPWDVLLLFGGGLSLAAAVESSGLTGWIGGRVTALGGLPATAVVVLVTATIILLTELTSNTATTSAFLPILGGVAVGLAVEPLALLVPATLAASCAFMMPVATPPNAIVFGSGRVTIRQMVTAGLWLNLVGVVLISLAARYVYVLFP